MSAYVRPGPTFLPPLFLIPAVVAVIKRLDTSRELVGASGDVQDGCGQVRILDATSTFWSVLGSHCCEVGLV